jgi:hypothetical protein
MIAPFSIKFIRMQTYYFGSPKIHLYINYLELDPTYNFNKLASNYNGTRIEFSIQSNHDIKSRDSCIFGQKSMH